MPKTDDGIMNTMQWSVIVYFFIAIQMWSRQFFRFYFSFDKNGMAKIAVEGGQNDDWSVLFDIVKLRKRLQSELSEPEHWWQSRVLPTTPAFLDMSNENT